MRPAILMCVVGWLAAGPLAAQNGLGLVEVREVDFRGNAAFPDDSLRFAILSRQSECASGVLGVVEFLCFRRSEYLNRRALPEDVTRLRIYYYQRGYREARVDTALAYNEPGDEVSLVFQIEEGRPVVIDTLGFAGVEDLEVPNLMGGLPVREGDPLSAIKLDEAKLLLTERLQDAGYYDAMVFLDRFLPRGSYSARVTLEVDRGPRARFGDLAIGVSGEAELDEQVVRRMLPFQEGSLYSRALVQEGQRNLYSLEIVRSALVGVDSVRLPAAPDTLVPVNIDVGTSTLHRVRAGGGWSQAECLNTEARWVSRNFMGGARRLLVRGRISNVLSEELYATACDQSGTGDFAGLNWVLSTELNQPWVFGSPRNSLTASLFWERQALPDVFIRRAVGVNAAFTRVLGLRLPLVLSYRPQLASLDAAGIFFCTSFLVCQPEDVAALEDRNLLSPVGVGLSLDRTNNILDPADGYVTRLDLEYAAGFTLSNFRYTRAVGELGWYHEIASRTIFAARLRGGWIGAAEFDGLQTGEIDVIHPQKRFFAGGANSVRGFAQSRLGPRVLTTGVPRLLGSVLLDGDTTFAGCSPNEVANLTCDPGNLGDGDFMPRPTGGTRLLEGSLEYRFRFGREFQAVTFFDVGQVWSERQPFTLGDLELTPGFGVRWFSPIGPLRADLAYRSGGGEDLPVVIPRIRLMRPGEEDDRITVPQVDGEGNDVEDPATGRQARVPIPWVREDDLVFLTSRFPFESDLGFLSLRRLQLHISIGQAF